MHHDQRTADDAHPCSRVQPGRTITGMSAVLLPHRLDGTVDWAAFEAHLARTREAGLVPAVNMDTGYVQLLDPATRSQVLAIACDHGGAFVAGAYVADEAGDPFDADAYTVEAELIASHGGLPILFPSHGLNALADDAWVAAHAHLAGELDAFLAFELGPAFVPYGRIYSLDAYGGLLELPQCRGAKHSSLHRQAEWDRLALRDARRPDFLVLTGNDLAIDMVTYGSDYLLGLATFAPDAFAHRDRLWAEADPAFYELNDLLQYLGSFAFRTPVPAYRHDAALFLELRGQVTEPGVPAGAATRPHTEAEREVLAELAARLEAWL